MSEKYHPSRADAIGADAAAWHKTIQEVEVAPHCSNNNEAAAALFRRRWCHLLTYLFDFCPRLHKYILQSAAVVSCWFLAPVVLVLPWVVFSRSSNYSVSPVAAAATASDVHSISQQEFRSPTAASIMQSWILMHSIKALTKYRRRRHKYLGGNRGMFPMFFPRMIHDQSYFL